MSFRKEVVTGHSILSVITQAVHYLSQGYRVEDQDLWFGFQTWGVFALACDGFGIKAEVVWIRAWKFLIEGLNLNPKPP